MKINSIRRAIRFAGLVLPLSWMPGSALGQTANAQSYGVAVSTALVNQKNAVSRLAGGWWTG